MSDEKTATSERERWKMGVSRALEVLSPVVAIPGLDRLLNDEEQEAIRVLARAYMLLNNDRIAENNEAYP